MRLHSGVFTNLGISLVYHDGETIILQLGISGEWRGMVVPPREAAHNGVRSIRNASEEASWTQ